MKKILVVIDMQNDFLTGSLGNAECAASAEPVRALLAQGGWDAVAFTRDTHHGNYAETLEGRKLPVPHCLEGTEGWQIAPALRPFAEEPGAIVVDKPTFGSFALADALAARIGDEPAELHLCGVCTRTRRSSCMRTPRRT